jgi:transposase
LALRSRIVLAAAAGAANYEIAEQLGVSRPTVTKWRNRFAERRREGLLDEPRPGGPRTVTDEQVEKIVTTTLESTPKNVTHWTRALAAHLGVSQDAVWRTWQAFGLQPHRQEKFKLSADPQFVEKVYDIRGLYLNPPERTMVLCVDDRLAIRSSSESEDNAPISPSRFNQPATTGPPIRARNARVCPVAAGMLAAPRKQVERRVHAAARRGHPRGAACALGRRAVVAHR